jgi:hypothetical protein
LPAAVIWVDSTDWEGPGCTLRDAIFSASNNVDIDGCAGIGGYMPVDTIRFSVTGTIRWTGPITVSESVIIKGPGPGDLTLLNETDASFSFSSAGNTQSFQLLNITVASKKGVESGGVRLSSGDSFQVRNCVFRRNRYVLGGGIYNYQGNLQLVDSIFHGNETVGDPGSGGAVYSSGGDLTLLNTVISGNRADNGGGLFIVGGTALVSNSTVSGNYAVSQGGGIYSVGANTDLVNTIVWGDMAAGSVSSLYQNGGTMTATYSDIDTGCTGPVCFAYPGTGNMISVPLFVAPRPAADAPTVKGNYHLKVGSELIDQGTATGPVPPADMKGVPRPTGSGFDMGAYEHDGNYVANASFEYGPSRKPAPWKRKSLTTTDRRVGSKHSEGDWSFKFTGGPENKCLKQVIRWSGSAGDEIALTADSRVTGADPGGEAYRMDLKIIYSDDGGKRTYRRSFSKTRTGWQEKMINFTSRDDYGKLIVSLRYADQTGRAWFDNLDLRVE